MILPFNSFPHGRVHLKTVLLLGSFRSEINGHEIQEEALDD